VGFSEYDRIINILRSYKDGKVDEVSAINTISLVILTKNLNTVRLDVNRELRIGFPEIIYGPGKKYEDIYKSIIAFLEDRGRAFVYGLSNEYKDKILKDIRKDYNDFIVKEAHNLLLIKRNKLSNEINHVGKVALLTGGTVDVPYAEETALLLEELGVEVYRYYDVGVANLNRVLEVLSNGILKKNVDVIIVFAGMDGVLPVVTASLIPLPVIGVPISSGYGYGGEGQAALMTMLQSCVPGLVVVNINNTVGAAAAAYRIIMVKNRNR
jgi:NCAIR mutase (PurE)-related protein